MRSEMRRLAAAVAVVAAALCASGCAPESPGPGPTPQPTSTPLFASDEEALAAAEEAYARYQAVSDAILMAGGANSERLLQVATEEKLEYEERGYEELRSSGHVFVGSSTFNRMTLQARDATTVSVYVCDDITSVDVLGGDGKSVVSPDRPDIFPRTVTFVSGDGQSLMVSNSDEWTGTNFCA